MTFHPLTIVTAQAPTNTTSQTIQRGYTAPPALCAGPPSAASISPVRAAKAVSLCLASATALGGTRHTSTAARSRRLLHQSPSPILKQSFSNSNLIGLTLLLVKAVIGPSLRKMSLRAGAVLCLQELFTATDGPWFRIKGEIIASGDDFFPSPPPKNVLRSTYSSTQYRRYVLEVLF